MTTSAKEFLVFNDEVAKSHRTPTLLPRDTLFPFTRLPAELRLKVWKSCFPPQRYISIVLSDDDWPKCYLPGMEPNEAEQYTTSNDLGNVISGSPYRLLVSPFQQWSRILLHVSREARQAFRCHYRLSIPLKLGEASLLHINPETDTLEVQRERPNNKDILVGFLHDAVAYDPSGVGIVHLAMGREMNDVSHLSQLEPSKINPSAVQSITKLLSKSLKNFYSCVSPGIGARVLLGQLSGPRAPIYLNRSIPIAFKGRSRQPTCFKILEQDPRPIDSDISCVFVRSDPRNNVLYWYNFLAKFGVSAKGVSGPPMKIRYLYAVWPNDLTLDPALEIQAAFTKYLEYLEERWAQWMPKINQPLWGNRVSEEEYHRLRDVLPDVAGIWIFEGDAFGDVFEQDPNQTETGHWGYKMVKDMTEFKPKLMVFDINENTT